MKRNEENRDAGWHIAVSSPEGGTEPNLKDPRVVMSLLEADQVVAAKRQSRFGQRNLSMGVRLMLWGLRVYVAVMLILVVVSVVRAIHSAH